MTFRDASEVGSRSVEESRLTSCSADEKRRARAIGDHRLQERLGASGVLLGDVEEATQGFSDDRAGRCLVGFGPGFDRCLQLRVDPNGYDIGRT